MSPIIQALKTDNEENIAAVFCGKKLRSSFPGGRKSRKLRKRKTQKRRKGRKTRKH